MTSYLNNDNIDQLTPEPKKNNISSLSLSDQFVSSFPSFSHFKNDIDSSTIPRSNEAGAESLHGLIQNLNIMTYSSSAQRRRLSINHERIASYAFAFDIDGVLVRGPDTLNPGIEAIKYLEGNNPYNIKVPYIFVTNGGGKHESVRAQDLSKRLKTEINVDQIVQGHTPMKELSSSYNNVLVVGGVGNTCRNVAKSYGFKNVYTPLDIMKWNPSVTPYYELTEEDLNYCDESNPDFGKIKFDAIMVFADSRNWAADQQIILELLMSKGGYMGTVSDNFMDGPPIYFAHSDFVWSTNYKLVRYGMGALQVSIAALFKEHTGQELKVIRFGKPQRRTFKYAEKVLHSWRKTILEDHIDELTSTTASSDIFSSNPDDDSKYKNVFDSETESDLDIEDIDDGIEEGEKDVLTIQSLNKLRSVQTTNISPLTSSHTQIITRKSKSFTTTDEELPPPSTVYFVGDTPESDIRFANSHDESWFSILVNTGVYKSDSVPKYKPKFQCNDVLEAVKFAVEREHQKELNEWNTK